MPGGPADSSKTRVASFFDHLFARDPTGESWLPRLLTLPAGGSAPPGPASLGPLIEHAWWPEERTLDPPPSLLSWQVRNLKCPSAMKQGDARCGLPDLVRDAPDPVGGELHPGETEPDAREWSVMEGPGHPHAYVATSDAVAVVEGEASELDGAGSGTEPPIHHRILQHLDAALGPAGPRSLWGFLMVEGADDGSVPRVWLDACAAALDPDVLKRSLPHRSSVEREFIAGCFLGAVTWRRACEVLGVPF